MREKIQIFFEIFLKPGKSHSAKNLKEDPLGFFEHPFCCKIEKNRGGTLWRHLKNMRKKVSQSRNNMHKKFGQGRDSNPRLSVWQTSKNPN